MRVESDSMGQMEVPKDALYGAQTRRAELNFPVSGNTMPPGFIHSLARVKRVCAKVNGELGKLDEQRVAWICAASNEVMDGLHDNQFVVDVFQTGSGTSTNMNMNEVISNRAIQLAGGTVGSREPVHPNDHVNMGQSSNDVIPTALHVSMALALAEDLLPELCVLESELEHKAEDFCDLIKIGRTHLQDATPIRLGQVFGGYAAQITSARRRIEQALESLLPLAIGGTAVGTGINTHPEFGQRVAGKLAEETGLSFREAENHVEAQAARDGVVETMGLLKTVAISMAKIANDVRLLSSGPRCGLGELKLPAIQPGSSIMPGKVNPVICESVIQAASFVVGADSAVAFSAGMLSQFELSVAMPLMAWQGLEAIKILSGATRVFVQKALKGLEADAERCNALIEESLAMCTSLAPVIGYDAAAAIAKEAYAEGKTIREVAAKKSGLSAEKLDELLNPMTMTEPSAE